MSIGTKFMETLRQHMSAAHLRGDTALGAVQTLKKDDILTQAKARQLGLSAVRPNEFLRRAQAGDKNIISLLAPRARDFEQRINAAGAAHQPSSSTSNSMTATSPMAIR